MTRDDDFKPRLGKIRSPAGRMERRYLQDVLKAASRAGGRSDKGGSAFHGNRIGRGSGIGRVMAKRDRYAAFRSRRVIVKTRIVKLQGRSLAAARLHMRYIQRDGVTREGTPGELYDAEQDRADGKAFLERSESDRHQFRFIVSADDGAEYDDLRSATRRLMARMESDLGTRLDWVAADHYNTGHPHTHVVLRGKDDRNKDLVIAREYITHGMRERAAEIVTLDLGPRSDQAIEATLRQEVEQERFTSLDRALLRDADESRIVSLGSERDSFRQSLRMGRLQKLARLGLAENIAPGCWQLAEDLKPVLVRMGERGDILRTMQRALSEQNSAHGLADYAIYDPKERPAASLIGRIVARGLSDEINDRHYLIVDATDGYAHYVDIGNTDERGMAGEGSIVAIAPRRAEPREADRTIARIADAHDGRYSIDIHLAHDPAATREFAQAHVRRLEALRRSNRAADREPDGTWIIAPDHLKRAMAHEERRVQAAPVLVETLSTIPLDRMADADGATWLDRHLMAETSPSLRDAGFGHELRQALIRRQQWLIEQDLAQREQNRILFRANMLGILRRRELNREGATLAGETGKRYVEAPPNGRIEGVYRRKLDLVSGRFAMIEKSREFTLVPWRPALEHGLGKSVTGMVRGATISWSIGRQRGPSVS